MTKYVGALFNAIRSTGQDPQSKIELIVHEAFSRGFIDNRMYDLLKVRIPFRIYEREELSSIANRFGTDIGVVRMLEAEAYMRMTQFANSQDARQITLVQMTRESYLQMFIDAFPWEGGNASTHAINTLTKFFGAMPTANQVLNLFTQATSEQIITDKGNLYGRGILGLWGYNKKSAQATYEAFRRVGIELPQVRIG